MGPPTKASLEGKLAPGQTYDFDPDRGNVSMFGVASGDRVTRAIASNQLSKWAGETGAAGEISLDSSTRECCTQAVSLPFGSNPGNSHHWLTGGLIRLNSRDAWASLVSYVILAVPFPNTARQALLKSRRRNSKTDTHNSPVKTNHCVYESVTCLSDSVTSSVDAAVLLRFLCLLRMPK